MFNGHGTFHAKTPGSLCLVANCYTFVFLGDSVDICCLKEHVRLMDSIIIIENGIVISEYPPTTEARVEYFPRRNMIISSFSNNLLVVEATRKRRIRAL